MSEEKKARRRAERDEKRRQEERRDRRAMALYTAVGVAVVAAAAVLMFWNSGILQRGVTALDVNGVKYTAAEVQYYYSSLYSEQANSYAFLPSVSVKEQTYDQETGQSWYDHLLEQAVEELTTTTALAAQAKSEGYTLSQEAQDSLDSTISQLNTAWIGYGYSSRDAFIRGSFGAYMTYDRLVALIEQEILASDYASAQLDAIDHPDADYEAYYRENADSLDTLIYTQFTFRAGAPTTDDEGNPLELSDEEKAAAIEEQKPAQKALAEEVKARLEGGADPEELAEEYEDQLYSVALSRRASGVNVSMSIYSDWLLDAGRRAGDITLAEQETVDSYYYYVSVFEERFREEEDTNTVRHILVRAGSDPTQEEYDTAEASARELLDQWRSGEATEDSFAALASSSSNDTSTASGGGLISGITSSSSYGEAFQSWAIDPARKPGDVELVRGETGWHIMYYVSNDGPAWRAAAGSALREQDQEQLSAAAVQGWSVTRGAGMRFVSA